MQTQSSVEHSIRFMIFAWDSQKDKVQACDLLTADLHTSTSVS